MLQIRVDSYWRWQYKLSLQVFSKNLYFEDQIFLILTKQIPEYLPSYSPILMMCHLPLFPVCNFPNSTKLMQIPQLTRTINRNKDKSQASEIFERNRIVKSSNSQKISVIFVRWKLNILIVESCIALSDLAILSRNCVTNRCVYVWEVGNFKYFDEHILEGHPGFRRTKSRD